MFTFEDAINHGLDYLGGTRSDQAVRDCKRSILAAYLDLVNAHNWTYLYTHGRLLTSGAYDSATDGSMIAYDHTGGTYERQVTLTGGMWPDWAGDGTYLKVGQAAYRVAQRKSATVLTLADHVNPGDDLAAGTAFQLYRDTYLLPEDYVAQDQSLFERNFGGMDYTHPKEWLYENRYVFAQGVPQFYTITGDTQYPGRLVMRVFPWPMESKSIDFIYKRRSRPLLLSGESTGKVAMTALGNAVTGTGTAFTPNMVGSLLRIASNGLKLPTSIVGDNPAVFESLISGYSDAGSILTLDAPDTSITSAAFTISDPVDIEEGAMLNAFLRGIEKNLGMSRTLKDKPSARAQYDAALAEAKAADSRSFMGRAAGPNRPLRRRLRDYPINLTDTQ